MPRAQYQRLVKTLSFVDLGTVRFPGVGVDRLHHRLPLGRHVQTADVDGIVLARVFTFTTKNAASQMQIHNRNAFPIFVEIDYGSTALGNGGYVALAPGEARALWSWDPTLCLPLVKGTKMLPGAKTLPADCNEYNIWPGTARVRTLKEWKPG
jgi:hypothetical protein